MPTGQLLQFISHDSAAYTSHSSSQSRSSDPGLVLGLAIGGTAGVAILLVAFLSVLFRWLKSSRTTPYETSNPVKLQKFSYWELKDATVNFSPTQRLGQGGFGVVFKGALRNGKDIAVKRLDAASLQGEREFQNEVSVIGRVNSPHIVGLLGYCVDGKKRLLVYEYMENGSLQEALFDEMYAASLDWETRFKIILDTARGLAFLHYKCDPPIIHGDVKPSNILLDKHFAARIADFGLARLKSEEGAETVRSEELEREHIERERTRYERVERERACRAMRRREGAQRKRSSGSLSAIPGLTSNASPEKRWEGTHEKSPLGRVDDLLIYSAPKNSEFVEGLGVEVVRVAAPSAEVGSVVFKDIPGKDGYPTMRAPRAVGQDDAPSDHVDTDISDHFVVQSPLSVLPSPSTMPSSMSTRRESPSIETLNVLPGTVKVPGNAEEERDASGPSSPEVGKKKYKDGSSPSGSSLKTAQRQDDVIVHVPDLSVKEETEPEGWSTISPSEGYRDDLSVESGRSGKDVHHGIVASQPRRLWSRDWWWRQDANGGELTIKDFITWTPSKSVTSEGKGKSSSSKDWVGFMESSGDILPLSQSRRVDSKKAAELKVPSFRSSVGSDAWGELSGEVTGKNKESKQQPQERGKNKYTIREWWEEGEREVSKGKGRRDHSKIKGRDSCDSKVGETKRREWWREENSGELTHSKLPKSDPLLSLSREGSRREKSRNREWWREERSGELSRSNSKRRGGQFKDTEMREKSRSRDWLSGDLLARNAVGSNPSMRGTICYVAPEYGGGGILTEKSDVYSFGVLMLVIISGRRPLQVVASPIVEFERANLISWARHLAQSGNVLDLVDGMLQGQFSDEQAVLCITVALLCLQRLPAVRPTMGEVVKILLGESEVPTLPFEFSPSPSYFLSRQKPCVERVPPSSVTSEDPLLV